MKLSSFFPQDTRITELASAWGLLLFSVFSCFYIDIGLDSNIFMSVQSIQFWIIIFGTLGFLQLFSIVLHPSAEILRAITAWINGSLWIWIGISSAIIHFDPPIVGVLCLGVANLYGFALNILMLHKRWEE